MNYVGIIQELSLTSILLLLLAPSSRITFSLFFSFLISSLQKGLLKGGCNCNSNLLSHFFLFQKLTYRSYKRTKKHDGVLHQNDVPSFQLTNKIVDSLNHISWRSVFAGVLIAVVIQIALGLLGIGIGLRTVDQKTEVNLTDGLGKSSAVWYIVSCLTSLFAGGWIASRLAQTR